MKTDVRFTKEVTSQWIAQHLSWLSENGFSCAVFFGAFNDIDAIAQSEASFLETKIKVAGGLFPSIIFNEKLYDSGLIVIGIEKGIDVLEVDKDPIKHSPNFTSTGRSAVVFFDALCDESEKHIENINAIIDTNRPVVGMGAGSIADFLHRPAIFSNSGLLLGKSLLVLLDFDMIQKTAHGYKACEGPFLVTKSIGTTVYEMNYENAYDLYRTSIHKKIGKSSSTQNFFEWASLFPLGIENMDGSVIIRHPYSTDGASITSVGSVPENAVVYIMEASKDNLITAANRASKGASERYEKTKSRNPELAFLVDCVSRKLALGDDFEKEIAAVRSGTSANTYIGVLSLGEVSNYQAAHASLLNKTLVVSLV